jgi:hypothetical protein
MAMNTGTEIASKMNPQPPIRVLLGKLLLVKEAAIRASPNTALNAAPVVIQTVKPSCKLPPE